MHTVFEMQAFGMGWSQITQAHFDFCKWDTSWKRRKGFFKWLAYSRWSRINKTLRKKCLTENGSRKHHANNWQSRVVTYCYFWNGMGLGCFRFLWVFLHFLWSNNQDILVWIFSFWGLKSIVFIIETLFIKNDIGNDIRMPIGNIRTMMAGHQVTWKVTSKTTKAFVYHFLFSTLN